MGMSAPRSDEGDEASGLAPIADINVTPLVDVMLVLLIIFMVAAPLMTVGVPVSLPKTGAPKIAQPKTPITVSIDAAGQPFLDREPLDEAALLARLRSLSADDKDRLVLVRGDRGVSYGRIMEVMGRVGAAGFSKVSLVAEAPSTASP
jgi:biopolymer transport protein TolR